MTVLAAAAAVLLWLLTLLWALLVVGAGAWGRGHRLGRPVRLEPPVPRLSVCIPARDEAGRIGAAVAAARALDYPELEIVVVDDRSSDATGEEARTAADGDPRVAVVEGTEPPAGWAGKPWACARAAAEAGGELLLFIDADVRLAPWSAATAVARLRSDDVALLSLFGDWELVGFWERTVVPVVGWFIRGTVDLDAVNDPDGDAEFANGQFILVRREDYEAAGGHGAVRAEVLDDVRLARAFRRAGRRLGLVHAPGAFSVRLYESLGDIVRGYAKNLFEGMDRRPAVALLAVVFICVGTLLPWALLIALPAAGVAWPWTAWAATLCALMLAFRWRIERADGRSGWHAATHVLGNAVFVWILLRSALSGRVEWKGRAFVGGKAGDA